MPRASSSTSGRQTHRWILTFDLAVQQDAQNPVYYVHYATRGFAVSCARWKRRDRAARLYGRGAGASSTSRRRWS